MKEKQQNHIGNSKSLISGSSFKIDKVLLYFLLENYADLILGCKIRDFLKDNDGCYIEAEL